MRAEIHCDTDGCTERIAVSEFTSDVQADALARREGWLVRVGSARSYHHCPRCSDRLAQITPSEASAERVQNVLQRARELTEPRGVHAAIRDLKAEDIADAVWAAFYASSHGAAQ